MNGFANGLFSHPATCLKLYSEFCCDEIRFLEWILETISESNLEKIRKLGNFMNKYVIIFHSHMNQSIDKWSSPRARYGSIDIL